MVACCPRNYFQPWNMKFWYNFNITTPLFDLNMGPQDVSLIDPQPQTQRFPWHCILVARWLVLEEKQRFSGHNSTPVKVAQRQNEASLCFRQVLGDRIDSNETMLGTANTRRTSSHTISTLRALKFMVLLERYTKQECYMSCIEAPQYRL